MLTPALVSLMGVKKHLNNEEIVKLIVRSRKNNGAKKQELRELIYNNFVKYIVKVAKKYSDSYRLDFDDTFSSASLQFLIGIDKFDETRGVKFLTYITYWIENGIFQAQKSSNIITPASHQTPQKNKYLYNQNLTWLDKPIASDDGGSATFGEFIADTKTKSSEEMAINNSLKEKLINNVNKLNCNERQTIKYRFLVDEPLILDEIANKLGITRERIRQIEANALRKLKVKMVNCLFTNKSYIAPKKKSRKKLAYIDTEAKRFSIATRLNSPESIAKRNKTKRGLIFTDEHCKNISMGKKNPSLLTRIKWSYMQRKFNDETIDKVKKMLDNGSTYSTIEKETGVGQKMIWKIKNNKCLYLDPQYKEVVSQLS